MLWVVQCEELLITKLINSSVFHLDIFIYVVGNMIVCCINSKTYFVLEQITNTLKDLFNVARSEEFFSFTTLAFGIFCVSCHPPVKWAPSLPA